MEKFLSSPEELATNKPNYDKRFGLNQSNSKIKNNLTDCLMRFLFFSRATFFRRCLQRVVLVVILFFVVLLISCIDSEGNLSYNIKVSASEFEDKTDYSNIPRLYEQPLHIIKKAIEGDWQMVMTPYGYKHYDSLFAKITKDSVIFWGSDTVIVPWDTSRVHHSSFQYKWRLNVYKHSHDDYNMMPQPPPQPGYVYPHWTAMSITNDTLWMRYFGFSSGVQYFNNFYLIRKEGE